MSLICGVFALRQRATVPDTWRSHLRINLNRGEAGTISEFDDGRLFLLKLDIGAFIDPGWTVSEQRVTALAGHPIVTDAGAGSSRAEDMAILSNSDSAGLRTALRTSRGYFNLVRYDRTESRLSLANGRVGVRSLYICRQDDLLVFSGAQRLIETLPGLRLTADLKGVLETASFGVPLGERTRYKEIRCLRGGTLLHIASGDVTTDRYWRFDRDACTEVATDLDATLDELYSQFDRAVALRAGRRKAVFSALSGGLDSRSVTTALWRRGLEVHALNVSWRGSQDDVLGRMAADALGIAYHHSPRPIEESGNSLAIRLSALILEKSALCPDLPSTRRQIWSGNGGSVGLGHVKMPREVVALLNSGNMEAAARHFIKAMKFSLSGLLLRGATAFWAERLPLDSLMAELATIRCAEPARALYIFELEHDQRRLLAFHFEEIDLVPFEFIEPLFDAEVLSVACRLPMDYCLNHHMYHEWLKRFPPETLSVPWQAYPGHEPCPIPLPAGTFDQWRTPRPVSCARTVGRAASGTLRYLSQLRRYRGVLHTSRVLAAYLMYALQLRDTSHLLKQVELIGDTLINAGL